LEIVLEPRHISLDPGWVVSDINPRRIEIAVSGPAGVVDGIDAKQLPIKFEVARNRMDLTRGEGEQTFEITERMLGLPAAASLTRVPPVSVAFSLEVAETLAIDDHFVIEGLPLGFDYTVQLSKTHVAVHGPKTVVEKVKQRGPLAVEKVIAPPLDPPPQAGATYKAWPIRIQNPHDAVMIPDRDRLYVEVRLTPKPMVRQTPSLPIRLLISQEDRLKYTIELASPEVVLDVSGPAVLLREYDLSQLRAYVDLTGPQRLDLGVVRPILVQKEPWMEHAAREVKVTVRLRTEAVPPVGPEPPPAAPAPPPADRPASP
jgi:hypothetical protein